MLLFVRMVGLTVEERQRIARHWILMRTNSRWN